ncbi:hypothetical protein [Paenibacillus sp. TSA_86.1]|uniref:hypothetical protein n=1 Tax=Paenibacillus sp. TSA_86.1 TaxID=3415649 RepID=UPI004045B88E
MYQFFKRFGKLFGITLLCVSLFPAFSTSKAEANNDVQQSINLKKYFNSSKQLKNNSDQSVQSVVITDRETINAIAKEQSLDNPDSINEIQLDSVVIDTESEVAKPSNISPSAVIKTKYHIENIKDLDIGWSFRDKFISHLFQGPAEIKQTFSKEDTFAIAGELGTQLKDIIEAKFSVTLGTKKTQSTEYKFSVPSGRTTELRIFTNYHKKSYEVWNLVNGLDYNLGTENFHKSVGLIFLQVKYN